MPLKYNRSQQVIPAHKIEQQGTEFFSYLLFFLSSYDLNTMGGQYIRKTLDLKEQFDAVLKCCFNPATFQYVIYYMSRKQQRDHLFWKARVYEQVTC